MPVINIQLPFASNKPTQEEPDAPEGMTVNEQLIQALEDNNGQVR